MNLDSRWLGASVVRVRVLAAGLALLAAGCMVLGLGSRSRQMAAHAAAPKSALHSLAANWNAPAMPSLSGQTKLDAQAHALSVFSGLPMMFEPNQGQANLDPSDARVKFVARGSGYSLYLGSEGAILNLRSPKQGVESVQMRLAGANPNPGITATDILPGKSNYIIGNDPSKWRQGISQFARVHYENVYPGIKLVFYGNQGHLEYDFQVAPGFDPKQAELEFNGAKSLELQNGALLIKGDGSDVRLDAPQVYQEIAGRREPVEGRFVLRGANRAGFSIGSYDHSRELVIDPKLSFATYFGGSGDEHNVSVAVDTSFNVYLAGSTTSLNLPASGSVFQATRKGTQNVFIARMVPTQGSNSSSLAYVTYLGGSSVDYPVGIAVDGSDDPYVAGTTTSTDFPTTSTAYQTTPETGTAVPCVQIPSGICHVFVTELNNYPAVPTQQLVYSSYLSGNGNDVASGMTIDASGDIFVTGTTTSSQTVASQDQFPATNLPQPLPYQSTSKAAVGLPQFFVTKVNTNATRTGSIAYSTYFGGGNAQTATPIAIGGGIAVDQNGNVYFSGTTNYTYTGCAGCSTTDFPILNPYQPCLGQQPPSPIPTPPVCTGTASATSDAFVAKLNLSGVQGQQLAWSTYFGGAQTETGTGVAVDVGAANVYLTGTTNSANITTPQVAQQFQSYQSCLDQYPNPASGTACTNSNSATAYPNDAYVARFSNPTATSGTLTNVGLTYFSYLGGAQNEAGLAIAVDSASGAILTGWTQSTDFPVVPAANDIQGVLLGAQNAFMARLNTAAGVGQVTAASWSNYYGGSNTDEGTGVAVDVNGNSYFAGDTNSPNLRLNGQLPASEGGDYNGGYDAFVAEVGSSSSVTISGQVTLGTSQIYISAGNQATFTYTVTNSGPDLAQNLVVVNNISAAYTQVPLTFSSATATSGTCSSAISTASTVACTIPTLQAGSTATVTFVVTPTPPTNSSGAQQNFNGGTVQVLSANNIILAQTSVAAKMSDYTMTATPIVSTVAAGQTASYLIQLFPHPVYASNVSLSCSTTPPASACTFTTPSVSLLGPGSSTLNITTTARPIVTPAALLLPRQFYALWLCFPGLAIFGLGAADRRRRRIAGAILLSVLFGLLLLQPACSKGTTPIPTSGTPAGNYTITINATSGTDTKTTNVPLNVH